MVHVAREMEREGFTLRCSSAARPRARRTPRSRSRPHYRHARRARARRLARGRRGRPAARARQQRAQFAAENRAAQEKLRERASARESAERRCCSLEEARRRAHAASTGRRTTSPRPAFTGVRTLRVLPARGAGPVIDWSPFFHTWELKGTYPRDLRRTRRWGDRGPRAVRRRPAAARAHRDASACSPRTAVYGFFPANSDGDDIVVYTDETRARDRARPSTSSRQQARQAAGPAGSGPGRLRRAARDAASPTTWAPSR